MDLKISVIMAVLNDERYVYNSIESVLNQTLEEFELIIVNDGSTDSTENIILSINDSRITYIALNSNQGIAKARNIGIGVAKGKYIAFIDSDDVWMVDKLTEQIKFMEYKNYKFTYSFYDLVDVNNNKLKSVKNMPVYVNYKMLLKSNFIPLLTVIIKKELLVENNFLNVHHEDYATWLQILKVNNTCAMLFPKVTAKYRVRENSVSGNKFRSILWTWQLYRKTEKLSLVKSIKSLISNMYFGLIKHHI